MAETPERRAIVLTGLDTSRENPSGNSRRGMA